MFGKWVRSRDNIRLEPSGTTTAVSPWAPAGGGAYLDPLVRPDVAEGDGGIRPVQQHLVGGAGGVVAAAEADGNHPAGTLLGCWGGGSVQRLEVRGQSATPPATSQGYSPLCVPLAQNFF